MSRTEAIKTMHSLTVKSKLVALGVLLAALLAVPSARAASSFGVASFSTGSSTTQAGAHADVSTSFTINSDDLGNPIDQLKDVSVNLPKGLVGNPQAIPMCSDKDFQVFNCPTDAQVGILNAAFVISPGVSTTLVSQVPNTTLTADVSPGQGETIQVATTAGITSGDYITIGTGADADMVPVSKVLPDGTSLQLAVSGNGVVNPHSAGDTVADNTITVASTSGFEGSPGLNNITVGTGADQEDDTIAFAPGDSNRLILDHPLQNQHAPGEPVTHVAQPISAPIPVFNLQPDPGHVATFAASFLIATIIIEVDVNKDGSYALQANLRDLSTLLTIQGSSLTFWGVPGDPSHDNQRCGQLGFDCRPSNVTQAPFMTNPTACGTAPTASITMDSWQDPSTPVTATTHPDAPTGCDKLNFNPTLSVAPDNTSPDTPAGYDVNLSIPQNNDPFGLATPDLQNATVTLPPGVSLSPAVANGLQGCSDATFDTTSTCPNASKVGTVSIHSPLLPDPLTGSIYIGSPTPSQMYRLFVVANGDDVTIKLKGQVKPSASGQLTTVFSDNPQLPFDNLDLKFFGGPLAALANPESCGTFTTTSDLSPYGAPAAADATPTSSFQIAGCQNPTPFNPSFAAGTTNATAGAFSPLSVTFGRQDSDQELSSITATLPPGLFAKIAGVTQCSNADAAAGTCPASSQVGTATAGSGAGSHPLFLGGKVYLTGPYNGGAYGLATVIPAVAGPYNLGTVVVRQSLRIDPNDAHVTAVSDPFPTILKGVPLRIKTVNLTLNRPDFTINPTSCQTFAITGAIQSVNGAVSRASSPFQVGSCASLPFSPTLGIKLSGKGQTKDGKHPTLAATLTAPSSGQANLKSAKVTLPLSLALDPRNTETVCSVAAAAAINCPSNTIVGTASAVSPLLPDPLSGNVFLVQGIRTNKQGQQIKTLPSLLIPLKGDVQLNLRAQTAVSNGRLVTTFPAIPDAAVSNFKLTINGGSHGILVITHGKNICKSSQFDQSALGSQSGKKQSGKFKMGTPACGKTHSKRHAKKHARRHR
jgi:hypothetical protein